MLAFLMRAAPLGFSSAAVTPVRRANRGARGSMLSPASLRLRTSRYASSRFGRPGYRETTSTALTMLPPSPSDIAIDRARELGGLAPRIASADVGVQRLPCCARRLRSPTESSELCRERCRVADRKEAFARQRQGQIGRNRR